MGICPTDVDFATTATPEQMKAMFEAEEIRMLNTKGEKHGTITVRINDKENFEVTTLRIDVATDGRHAEVQFTTDWQLDANRRDLTINSMFLGIDGSIYDYFYGYEDVQQRRIAFVGNADSRIKEDYLRILRYFRFYGRIAKEPDNHEENTLRVISQNVTGLERISGERIWSELKKILECKFAGELLSTMHHVGVTRFCGLPNNPDMEEMTRVWTRSRHQKLHPVCLLATTLSTIDDAHRLNERLRMSSHDRDLTIFIIEHKSMLKLASNQSLQPYKRLALNIRNKPDEGKAWVLELLKCSNSPLIEEFSHWQIPKFPISGHMLRSHGITNGRQMGKVINALRNYWIDNDFKPTNEEILSQIPNVQEHLAQNK